MNVCLFTDSFIPKVGGKEYMIHYLAKSLSELEINVTVMAKTFKNESSLMEENRNYKTIRFGFNIPGSGRTGLDTLSSLHKLIKEHKKRKFDVIHCHNVSYPANRVILANKFLNLPLIITPHGSDLNLVGLRFKKRWNKMINRNLLLANAVTAISEKIKFELNFLSKDKLYKIPNGIDTLKFKAGRSSFLHKMLSLPISTKIVLSVGRYNKVKGFEYGLKAFDELKKYNKIYSEMVYVIIGNELNKLEQLVMKNSLINKVFLLPNQNHKTLIKSYRSAFCFFSPSISEGLSLVSLEAMATGTPLILTNVGGNLDIINENNCGLLVKSQNPASMAKGILTLASNKKMCRNFTKNALKNAPKYDWKNIADQYLKIYYKVINSKRGEIERKSI